MLRSDLMEEDNILGIRYVLPIILQSSNGIVVTDRCLISIGRADRAGAFNHSLGEMNLSRL